MDAIRVPRIRGSSSSGPNMAGTEMTLEGGIVEIMIRRGLWAANEHEQEGAEKKKKENRDGHDHRS